MPSRLAIAVLTFLFASVVCITGAVSQEVTPEDNAKINEWMDKARGHHYSNPDSAIYYYRLIYDNSVLNEQNITGELSDPGLTYLETVIRALNYTGNIYYYDDQYNRSRSYYERSLELATASQLKDYIGRALFDLGYVSYVSNDYKEAKQLFERSYRYYYETGNDYGMYDALHACGLTSRRLGDFNSADSCYSRALDIVTALGDSLMISDIRINAGILLCEQGRLEEGIILFEEALEFYERIGNNRAVSIALLNIGVVMKMVNEYEKALQYIERSTEIEEVTQGKSQLVVRYYNMADLYLEMGYNEKAYEYCMKIQSVANEIGSRPFTAECDFLMGKYHFIENDYVNAETYLKAASESAANKNDQPLITNIELWLAKTFLEKNNVENAVKHAAVAYSLAEEMMLIPSQKEASFVLFKAYELDGDAENALLWHKTFLAHSDSINHFNQKKEISRIEAQYNYEKKEKENELLRNKTALQEQKLRNRSIVSIALIVAIVLSGALIFLLVRRNRDAKLLYKQQQMLNLQKLEEIEKELDGKKRELASKMMYLNQKNELINRIIRELQEIQDSPDQSFEELNDIVSELKVESPQSNWKEFEAQFTQVHPDFYKRLYNKHPDLSSYEQRICAFLRMNLNTKEISAITGRSLKSIEVTRSRIRKKLNLSRKDNLNSFLASI